MEWDLNYKMEQMRKEKDKTISELTLKIEEMRKMFETKINKLTITIETHERTIKMKDSEILSLEQSLQKLKDVEKQLEDALKREKENNEARD